MKASLILILGMMASGCTVYSRGYVATPRRDVEVHHHHHDQPRRPRVRHRAPRAEPAHAHTHFLGCGHVLRGGIWVSVN